MYDKDFQAILAAKTGIELAYIRDMFETHNNPYEVADELIDEFHVNSQKLGEIWGSLLGFAYVDPNSAVVAEEYLDKLGSQYLVQNNIIPLYKFGRALTVATSDPENPYALDKLEKKLDCIVSFVFCFPRDIKKYIETH